MTAANNVSTGVTTHRLHTFVHPQSHAAFQVLPSMKMAMRQSQTAVSLLEFVNLRSKVASMLTSKLTPELLIA